MRTRHRFFIPARQLGLASGVGLIGAVVIAGAAGGPARARGTTVASRARAPVVSSRSPTPSGGTVAERALLNTVLATQRPARIPGLHIVRRDHGVMLEAPVAAVRPTWELLVVGLAFRDRSARLGLPPVLEVMARQAGWVMSNLSGPAPPRASPARVTAATRLIRRVAVASGARITELTVSSPDGIAVALRVRVRNAASFLTHRLGSLVTRADTPEGAYEGLYIEVDDDHGAAWIDGETPLGGDDFVRPSLAGCNPFPPPGADPGAFPACPAR